MAHSIELHMSEEERARIWEFVHDIEGPWHKRFNPHISLSLVRDEIDQEALRGIVQRFAERAETFTLQLSSIGMFPGKRPIVFFLPAANESLIRAHRELVTEMVSRGIEPIRHYRAGAWTPHLTISMGRPWAETEAALKPLLRREFPGSYQFEFVDLIEFHPAERILRVAL